MGGMPGGDPFAMGGMPGGDPFGMGGMLGGDPFMGGMPGGDPFMGGMPGGDPFYMAGMPGGDPFGMGGMPSGDPFFMGGDPFFMVVIHLLWVACLAVARSTTRLTIQFMIQLMTQLMTQSVVLINPGPFVPGAPNDGLDTSVPGAITGNSNPNYIVANAPNMVLTGAGGGDDLSNGGFSGVTFNYESAANSGVGFTQLWGEAFMDMINGGAINPTTGQEVDPGSGLPTYGADKGLGAGDLLRFGNADLYFGSTQLKHH